MCELNSELVHIKSELSQHWKKGYEWICYRGSPEWFYSTLHVDSVYSSFFVKKEDGELLLCIDYQVLNKITVKNRYPLPIISAPLESLDPVIFSKLELCSVCYLVRIREAEKLKTAFITPIVLYEYMVMPFWHCNSPVVFWNMVNDVLWDMMGRWLFVCLDTS